MRTCRLCRWLVTPDDVVVELREERCICLRCFLRETNDERPMSKAFTREIEAVLHAVV